MTENLETFSQERLVSLNNRGSPPPNGEHLLQKNDRLVLNFPPLSLFLCLSSRRVACVEADYNSIEQTFEELAVEEKKKYAIDKAAFDKLQQAKEPAKSFEEIVD